MTDVLDGGTHPAPSAPGPTVAPRSLGSIHDGPAVRVAIAIVAVGAAFHHSLWRLVDSLGVDSPLAYLGLVPFVSLALCIVLSRPRPGELDVHDRYLDRILGVPLLAVPMLMLAVLPGRLNTLFWLWRIDLLVLPLFVAGVVVLLFGTRTMLRSKAGLLFLFIAWPAPFQYLLQRWLDPFTSLTVSVVGKVAGWLHLASRAGPGGAGGGFVVSDPSGGHFTVLVASQCSGANSLLGYLLVAGALLVVLRGTRARKAAWLAFGAAVVWTANVFRILLIFLTGLLWGERVAIDGFHPYIGLVTFGVAMAGAVWMLPRFGLTFSSPRRRPGARQALLEAVPGIGVAVALIVAVAVPTAVLDARLARVDPIASALGMARLRPFAPSVMDGDGWSGDAVARYTWARQYFGETSSWVRYEFDGGSTELSTSLPIVADVVTTSDSQTFEDFGVDACYAFHGYDVSNRRTVDLGTGVSATLLSWKDPDAGQRWISLFWYWPIDQDGRTRYQRIVLLFAADEAGRVVAPAASPDLRHELGAGPVVDAQSPDAASTARDATRRTLLVGFGRSLVRQSVAHATGAD